MSKRFRDTAIWDRPWFRQLSPAEKCAWDYLIDKCDPVGVVVIDKPVAEMYIGAQIDWEKLIASCNGNIAVMENGKWWLKDFCEFQYGKISEMSLSKVQKNLYALLSKHGLWNEYEAMVGPTVAPTVQDKDKDKEKEKEKDKEKKERAEDVRLTDAEHAKLVSQYGEAATKAMYAKLSSYKGASGKKYRSDYKAILQWTVDAVRKTNPKLFEKRETTPICKECGSRLTTDPDREKPYCARCEALGNEPQEKH